MEIKLEGQDGSRIQLGKEDKEFFGRGSGFDTQDRSVSRRHVKFEIKASEEKREALTDPRVSFEVIGKNPIWVRSKRDGKVRIFKRFEKGELEMGDLLCLSGKKPLWFNLMESGFEGEKEGRELREDYEFAESGFDFEAIGVCGIDPIKEFGFLVRGHEFDNYAIRNVKCWDWFLEEPKKDNEDDDDDEDYGKKRKHGGAGRKRKKGEDNEDEEWTGDGEDDKEVVSKISRT